jgi:uncharacterized protein GlcG (DUF336 family)
MSRSLRGAVLALVPVVAFAVSADAQPLVQKNMSVAMAMKLIEGVNAACGQPGPLFTMSVAVIDRAGLPIMQVSGDTASPHNWELVFRKAYTARTYRRNSIEWRDTTAGDSDTQGQRALGQVIPLGGGVPIFAGDEIIGAVGVSGGEGGQEGDTACAEAGVAAIADQLQ